MKKKMSYLIESNLERAEVVLAAKAITDKLQNFAEQLAKVEADDIMPILDSMREMFGPQAADKFSEVTTGKIHQLIEVLKGAKSEIGNQIQRLEQGIEGGEVPTDMDDSVDMGMDDGNQDDFSAPEAEDHEEHDLMAHDEDHDTNLPEPNPELSNAAGRMRKESRSTRGRKLMEYKSPSFESNMSNLSAFDDQAGNIARDIEKCIDECPLPHAVHVSLSNVLNHLASMANDAAKWVDPETIVDHAFSQFGVYKDENIASLSAKFKKLAHCITLKHEKMIEDSDDYRDLPLTDHTEPSMYEGYINKLRGANNPDRVIFETFRKKLASTKNAGKAAQLTAESYFIDIGDVVEIIKEFKMNTPASKKGMFKGKTKEDLEKMRTANNAKSKAHKDKGEPVPQKIRTKQEEIAFALRAKTKGKGKWHKKVTNEATVDHIQGVPMFPIGQSTPVKAGQPAKQEPNAPGQSGPTNMSGQNAMNNGNTGMAPANTMKNQMQNKKMASGSQNPAHGQEQNVDEEDIDPNQVPGGNKQGMKSMNPAQKRAAMQQQQFRNR